MFEDELALIPELRLRDGDKAHSVHQQLVTAPLLNLTALQRHLKYFPSRGLLGLSNIERIYLNTNEPGSGIVCGVQGSGKTYTLCCILENALISSSHIGALPNPQAALVFHFDQQDYKRPCEAAFLGTPSGTLSGATSVPKITVLCSPSNLIQRTEAYRSLSNVRVAPLYVSEQDLTVDRVLALLGWDNLQPTPLYMDTVIRIMRSIGADRFTYRDFRYQLANVQLDSAPTAMLQLRLDLIDSFLQLQAGSPPSIMIQSYFAVGDVVLIDLTDPFLDGTTAGLLFDIVLHSFVGWQTASGKIVVLDGAHNYLTPDETSCLNRSVADAIRLQRHFATRVIVATQDLTVISRRLLDLSSFVICHRFSSPSWCTYLANNFNYLQTHDAEKWFQTIRWLGTGEVIIFSPTATADYEKEGVTQFLGGDYIKVRVRLRLTKVGGGSLGSYHYLDASLGG